MIRYSVRINLTDFISTPEEPQIIEAVHAIGVETGKKVFLKLWYRKDELTQEQVLDFVKRYETILEDIGTNIHAGEHETWTQKSWFNMRKRGTTTSTDYRHECTYGDPSGILRALNVFHTMVTKMGDINTVSGVPSHKKENGGHSNGYRVTIKRVPHA